MRLHRWLLTLGVGMAAFLGLLWVLNNRIAPTTAARTTVLTVCPDGSCNYDNIQDAVDAADPGDVIKIAQGTYTGVRNIPSLNTGIFTATQLVVVTKTLTLKGGYTTSDWDTPDPAAHPTTLDARRNGRVLVITDTTAPTIEGLRITGGDAAALGGTPHYPWIAAGGGVYVHGANPIISNCTVISNVANSLAEGWGGGLYLAHSAATLSGNAVRDNIASTASNGWGGGLYLYLGDNTLSRNIIRGNVGTTSGWGSGGGVFVDFADNARLSHNTIQDNAASRSSNGLGGGVYQHFSTTTLDGDIIISNHGAGRGGGFYLFNSDVRLTNGVIAGNQATSHGSGVYAAGSSVRLVQATVARNSGGDGTGFHATEDGWGNYSTLVVTNSILASHTVALTVSVGNTATLNGILWHGNSSGNTGGVGTIGALNERSGDPAFASDGYHLTSGSAAIDQGVDSGVSADIDGDPRPFGAGYDIGADEFALRYIYLPLVLRGSGQ